MCARIDPAMTKAQPDWNIGLQQRGISHGSSIAQSKIDSIKRVGTQLKQERELLYGSNPPSEETNRSLTAEVHKSFKGNTYNFWAPTDNSIAVSDDGFIVSVSNTTLLFADENGNISHEENFYDFASVLNLTGGYFDPRVIYDPDADKFIMLVLCGNTPATSTIVVAFSENSNPNEGWYLYKFSGDPGNENLWFDYPSIGISTDDLYVSGNQYTAEGTFVQSLIYQVEKAPAYLGENINVLMWQDIRDAWGNPDFTIVPVSFGFDGTIGPGIYLVSTDSQGGSEVTLYYTDGNTYQSPNLYAYSTQIPNYYIPFNGFMLGSTDELKTNDCRTQSAFYAEGVIHFAFNTRGDDFHTKISYCRLTVEDLSQSTISIGQQPYEFAFPAIAPFASETQDRSVVIGYLRSSGSIYPEFKMALVDHDMNYVGSSLIKAGEAPVDFSAETVERWGDYCGISRRHSGNSPEVWIAGCYAESNDNGNEKILSTWIAQVSSEPTATIDEQEATQLHLYPNPTSTGRMTVDFEIANSDTYQFYVVDERGVLVKNLLFRRVKAGMNSFSFDTTPLLPGAYLLVINDEHNAFCKSVRFIVI